MIPECAGMSSSNDRGVAAVSTYDHIFLRTGRPLAEVAERLSGLLELRTHREPNGDVYLTRIASDGAIVGGELHENIYEYPTDDESEQTLISDYETVWQALVSRGGSDVARQRVIELYEELAARSPWPALLIGGLDVVLAASRPGEPIHWFPPGTTPEPEDRAVWLPWAGVD